MKRFDLTRLAKADLMSIAHFTESHWGRKQRNAYLMEIDQVFRSLAVNPLIGRTCDEIRAGYRKLTCPQLQYQQGLSRVLGFEPIAR